MIEKLPIAASASKRATLPCTKLNTFDTATLLRPSARSTRRPNTQSKPSRAFAYSRATSSGRSWRSQSITTTQSPFASASPAAMALCWPKLRVSFTPRTLGSRAASAAITAQSPCGLWSSTITISNAGEIASSTGASAS